MPYGVIRAGWVKYHFAVLKVSPPPKQKHEISHILVPVLQKVHKQNITQEYVQ